MSRFNPPPTYAEVFEKDPATGEMKFNPLWLRWFVDLVKNMTSAGGGSVTSVGSGTGLQGGPITGAGTLSIADTAVTPGTYGSQGSIPVITIDQQGRITLAKGAQPAGYMAQDGQDGEDGWMGPQGVAGAAGATGSAGSAGPFVSGQDGEDGLDSLIPGPPGAAAIPNFYYAAVHG